MVIVLEVGKIIKEQRYKDRGSNQDATWLASKETKVSKIAGRMDMLLDGSLVVYEHEVPEASDLIAKEMLHFCRSI
jgi:hypothetical protein